MNKLDEKSTFWKITRLWWIFLAFLFLIHWMSLIVAGLEARRKKWILFGVLYAIPVFLFMIFNKQVGELAENIIMSLFFFSWFAAIIHSFAIRKEYLYLLANKGGKTHSEFKKKAVQRESRTKKVSSDHQSIYDAMLKEQLAIRKRYDEIDPLHQPNFIDIIIMVDHFIEQAEELIKKESEIDKIIAGLNIKQVENRITELNDKISKATEVELQKEYEQTKASYEKQRQIHKDFSDKKNVIGLRLESNLMNLKEIKYDLIKIDYVVDETKPHFLFEKADEISKEMDSYLESMKDTYNELNA